MHKKLLRFFCLLCGLMMMAAPGLRAGFRVPAAAAEAGEEVVVAVIDSGINMNHELLKDVLWHNPGIPGLEGKAGDVGYNFQEHSSDVTDIEGHGTHVSGIIAKTFDSGKHFAPGVKLRIMMVSTNSATREGETGLNTNRFLEAMDYVLRAKRAGVNIVAVNNSWGEGGFGTRYDELLTQLAEEGVVSFIAAGNAHYDLDLQTDCPADTDVLGAVTVGACDADGHHAGFSSYGKSSADLFAPGLSILSAYNWPSYMPNLMTETERKTTTEYYGQFRSGMSIDESTVVPETGGSQVKPFGTMILVRQLTEGEEAGVGPGMDLKVELSIDTSCPFSTDAMLKVTIPDAVEGDEYYLYFPYTKNSETTGVGNTLFSLIVRNGYQEGDNVFQITGGEVLVREGSCEIVNEQDAYFDCDAGSAGELSHVHYNPAGLSIPDEENGPLLPYSKLQNGDVTGIGMRITVGKEREEGQEPRCAPIRFYIDSLGVSIPKCSGATEENAYDLMSGTSMATPAATGLYALLAAQNPRKPGQSGIDYVREMLAKYLAGVHRTNALEDLCSTGGYLACPEVDRGEPSIVDAVSDIEGNTLTLYGRNLTNRYDLSVKNLRTGAVTPLPAETMSLEYAEDGRTLVIRGAEPLFNTYLRLILSENGEVRAYRSFYLVKGQAAPERLFRGNTPKGFTSPCLLADEAEENLYLYDCKTGVVAWWNGQEFISRNTVPLAAAARTWLSGPSGPGGAPLRLSIFTAGKDAGSPAYEMNQVYNLVEAVFGEGEGERKRLYLAALNYTAAAPAWTLREIPGYESLLPGGAEAEKPDACAMLEGTLYLFGADTRNGALSTYVLGFDPIAGRWFRGKDLSGMALYRETILRGDGRLFLMYARNGNDNLYRMVPEAYTFDGSDWRALKALPFVGRQSGKADGTYGQIEAACAYVDGNLMMMECSVEGGGSYLIDETETGACFPLYLTLRDGKADVMPIQSAARAGDWLYQLRGGNAEIGSDIAPIEILRIPYGHFYRMDRDVYEYILGSGETVVITARRPAVDRLTVDRFRSLLIGGMTVDPANYTVARGSVVLTLSPAYLDTLAVGRYPVTVCFVDGTAEAALIVSPKAEQTSEELPKTGDSAALIPWTLLSLLGLAGLALPRLRARRNS